MPKLRDAWLELWAIIQTPSLKDREVLLQQWHQEFVKKHTLQYAMEPMSLEQLKQEGQLEDYLQKYATLRIARALGEDTVMDHATLRVEDLTQRTDVPPGERKFIYQARIFVVDEFGSTLGRYDDVPEEDPDQGRWPEARRSQATLRRMWKVDPERK